MPIHVVHVYLYTLFFAIWVLFIDCLLSGGMIEMMVTEASNISIVFPVLDSSDDTSSTPLVYEETYQTMLFCIKLGKFFFHLILLLNYWT